MFDATHSPDLSLQLPADAYWQLVHTLRLALPPPLSDAPEDLARRDRAAIARIAALAPVNAAEAELAAQFVAASDQWKECLRLAQRPETTPAPAAKCRAQAYAMMRQSLAALRLLLRLQGLRAKQEADPAAENRAAWAEHRAVSLMAEALEPSQPRRTPEAGGSPAAPLASAPEPAASPGPEPPSSEPVEQSPPAAPASKLPWKNPPSPLGRESGEGSSRPTPAHSRLVSPHDPPSRERAY